MKGVCKVDENERLRRWRLMLGKASESVISLSECSSGTGGGEQGDVGMDNVLNALYDSDRSGGLESSAPNVARWLGDIRSYFPKSVVQLMQKDAIDRLGMKQLLL